VNSALMLSAKSDNWATPQAFYKKLDDEFNFTYDPCPLNAEFDSLSLPCWRGRAFVNPPYSNIRAFLEKALLEIKGGSLELAVFLVPARTDTRWFHDLVYGKAEVRFLKGRLKFGDGKNSAPFPSMVVVFRSPYSADNSRYESVEVNKQ